MDPKDPKYNEEYARHLEYAELMRKQDEKTKKQATQKDKEK